MERTIIEIEVVGSAPAELRRRVDVLASALTRRTSWEYEINP